MRVLMGSWASVGLFCFPRARAGYQPGLCRGMNIASHTGKNGVFPEGKRVGKWGQLD